MSIKIQALNNENFLPAFTIQQQCHFNPWSQRVFQDCLTPPYFAFQLCDEGEPRGYYVGMDVVGEATLMDIGVAQAYRGRGYGRLLLEHFVNHCKNLNSREIWLEVRQSNADAIHLYQWFDFNIVEIRKDYYPSEQGREDAIVMKRSL